MVKYCQRCKIETDMLWISKINKQRICFTCKETEKRRTALGKTGYVQE